MKYKHIIWDWNGTIVDDTTLSVEVLNSILALNKLPEISLDTYRETFSFPVSKFYENIGLRLSPVEFSGLGKIFMARYNAKRFECPLHEGVNSLMAEIKSRSTDQSILSAYHQSYLEEAASHYGINRFMSNIVGLENINAETKIESGAKLIKSLDAAPSQILIIGDTDHDLAVANETGADCALITRGHQSVQRLKKMGRPTFDNYADLGRHIFGKGNG